MKYFSLMPIILTLALATNVSGQDSVRSYLGVSFGGSDFHLKDMHASPLIFSSIGIAPTLQFLYQGDEDQHYAEVSYFYDYLGTSTDNFSVANHRARIRCAYLHSITGFNLLGEVVEFSAGGSINSFLCYSEYYYQYIPPNNARGLETWLWSNSMDLSVRFDHRTSPQEFFAVLLYVPLLSSVSRPAYSTSGFYNYDVNDWKFHQFGKIEVFPRNFSTDVIFIFQRPLVGSFNLQINYEWYYSIYSVPKTINMYMNNLRAGIGYCF